MGFIFNTKGSIISEHFKMDGAMYNVALYEDHLSIKAPWGKEEMILGYSRIRDAVYTFVKNKKKKKKYRFYLVVFYKTVYGEEEKLVLEDTRCFKGRMLARRLEELIKK